MVYNRICNCCGEKYYACYNCISINSWKNFCCSRECWRDMVANNKDIIPIELQGGIYMNKTILRAGLKDNSTISIYGYDLELGKFDCSDGKTRVFDDIEYFIIPVEEMKNISARLETKIEKSKKSNKKVVATDDTLTEDI